MLLVITLVMATLVTVLASLVDLTILAIILGIATLVGTKMLFLSSATAGIDNRPFHLVGQKRSYSAEYDLL